METHENIKLLREKLGLSQGELASLTGYKDRSSIAKIEAGLVDLPQSKIALFAKTLNVSPAYLMGVEEKPTAGQGDGPKERAHKLLDELPDEKLRDVMSYMTFLKSQQDKEESS